MYIPFVMALIVNVKAKKMHSVIWDVLLVFWRNTTLSKAIELGLCSILWKYMINTNCLHDKYFHNAIVKY